MPLNGRKVNLFIVGAAKCGTTSLYYYLSQHPDVFMVEGKEPRYFSSKYYKLPHNGKGDSIHKNSKLTKKEYLQGFRKCKNEKIIGEASVDYLYTSQVAQDLYEYNPDSKIIIILRNPVERAFSHYLHLYRDGRETESFEKALSLEEKRIKDNYEFSWHYTKVGMYYEQLEFYFKIFNPKQIKIILSEDLLKNTKDVIKDIYFFLNIPSEPVLNQKFLKYNKSGIPKIDLIQKIKNNFVFRFLLKNLISQSLGSRIDAKIDTILLKDVVMSRDVKIHLSKFFETNIKLLEQLLSINLDSWRYM